MTYIKHITISITIDTDMVIIIDHDQISQLQVTSKGGSFTGNTFLSTSITKVTVGVVI
jgi:hypothetical protein